MDEKNEMLEIDLDLDLETISPEDLIESLGIPEASTQELLDLLKRGAESAKIMFQSFRCENMKEYHAIGKRYAPIAFAIYGRLLRKHEEPRISTYLAANRYQATQCSPGTVIFWSDPDAIVGLYKSLEKDGYYASAKGT